MANTTPFLGYTNYRDRGNIMKCLLCGFEEENKREFGRHVFYKHGLSTKEYTVQYLCGNKRPVCEECGAETRYVSFSFKRFCKDHATLAYREGGKKGGTARAWNKGQTKETDDRIARQAKKQKGESNHFFGRHHTPETILKLKGIKKLTERQYYERLDKRCFAAWQEKQDREYEFELLTPYEEYYSRQHQYLQLRCVVCGEHQSRTLQTFERGTKCYKCFPIFSGEEDEFADYIANIGVPIERNTRNIIGPHELDVYVPGLNVAFEYNGLYWHSEWGNTVKGYHLNKTVECNKKGIQLIHIFADEWKQKRSIVESMIRYKLGRCNNRIHTRKCEIADISTKERKKFFDKNHIDGDVRATYCFALKYGEEVVACLSLRRPNHRNYSGMIEIARFATLHDTVIPGSFSKLLKEAIKYGGDEGYTGILTYADLRYGTGKVYENSGFECFGDTAPGFWWTDGTKKYNRSRFKASGGKSEKEVAEEYKVHKIWNCGSRRYRLMFHD